MNLDTIRRYAQIALAVVAVVAAAGAGYRYLVRGGSLFGEHVVAIPEQGPVGMRPFFDFPGFPGGREVSVYLCAAATGPLDDCAQLGKGRAGQRLHAKAIPRDLPDGTPVDPGEFVLRAGPDDSGEYPDRGSFEVVEFKVGAKPRSLSLDGVAPSQLRIGEAKQVARGAPCRPPLFLRDGRLAVGATVVDPATGVTIEFDVQAHELAWSPSGDKVAILTPDRKEIRLAAADGSGAVAKVREARGLLSSLSWAPSGDRLAFISQNDPGTFGGPGPPTVKILNATTGAQSSAGPGLSVAWSPQPDLLAVEMSGAQIQASTPDGGRRPLTAGRRPAWSPDGRYLTVVRGEANEAWIVPVEGGGPFKFAASGVCALSFSPSATSLAVVAQGEGTTLYVRSVEAPERE